MREETTGKRTVENHVFGERTKNEAEGQRRSWKEPGQWNGREIGVVPKIFMASSSMFSALKLKEYFQQALWPREGGKWG